MTPGGNKVKIWEKSLRLCSRVFFNCGQKWWRKLNRIVTSSALLQNGTYIWILVSIKRQFQVVYIDMKHDWKKATLIPAVAAKNRDASNLTRHFHWGLPYLRGYRTYLRKAVRHPSWKILVIIFIWIDKGHIVIKSVRNIWIFIMANSRNVDLTGKQVSRHQHFWRFPLSPLEASSRLPRSRDHLFLHSMSKASLPQGPNMWYFNILWK